MKFENQDDASIELVLKSRRIWNRILTILQTVCFLALLTPFIQDEIFHTTYFNIETENGSILLLFSSILIVLIDLLSVRITTSNINHANLIYDESDWKRIFTYVLSMIPVIVYYLNKYGYVQPVIYLISGALLTACFSFYVKRHEHYYLSNSNLYDLHKSKNVLGIKNIKMIYIRENEICIDTYKYEEDFVFEKKKVIQPTWEEFCEQFEKFQLNDVNQNV